MALKARVTWQYTPADFFEASFSESYQGIEILIEDGKVIAELDREKYEKHPEIHDELRGYIEGLFEGVRLQSHKDFEIEGGSVEKDRENGGQDLVVRVATAGVVSFAGSLDIKKTDAEGNVVVDTRQERIDSKREFARLVASKRGTDDCFDALIVSYSNAVKDPANELIHLYEVRDALAVLFGGEDEALEAIGISRARWSALGRLANHEPLKQGRHRGKAPSDLRDATSDELDQARSITRELIVRYAKLLET